MIKRFCILPFVQILDSFKTEGFVSTFHKIFYINKEVIIAELNLLSLKPFMRYRIQSNMNFLAISRHTLEKINPKYFLKSRYLKALKNLNNGYRSFAIIKGNEIIGDLWYATSIDSKQSSIHPDLKLYDIDIGGKGAYVYDVYTKHEERNNFVGLFLMQAALHSLREKGFKKVYGYVYADNTPALLIYKEFGYKELKRVKMWRFLFWEKTRVISVNE